MTLMEIRTQWLLLDPHLPLFEQSCKHREGLVTSMQAEAQFTQLKVHKHFQKLTVDVNLNFKLSRGIHCEHCVPSFRLLCPRLSHHDGL